MVQLGLIPRTPGDSAIPLLVAAGAPPPRPAEVRNIELDAADTNMYGNDVWGDCVFVMIEKDRVISAEALGVSITKLTAAQVVKNYCDYNGIGTDPKVDAPGPGSNILSALKWAQNHPERFGGSKLLFYGDFPITDDAAKEAAAEFGSFCVGVTVYDAMEYPAKDWYLGTRGKKLGGHGVPGGSYTPTENFFKTWGYEVGVNGSGFATVDEIVVCIWDFQWAALSYARQLEIIAAYTYYTGKPWAGPAAIPPAPVNPPAPPRTVMAETYTSQDPERLIDSRKSAPLAPGVPRTFQVTGLAGVPTSAVIVTGNLTYTGAGAGRGFLVIGPTPQANPSTSRLNFPLGDDRANSFVALLGPGGTLSVTYVGPAGTSANFIVDIDGYFAA